MCTSVECVVITPYCQEWFVLCQGIKRFFKSINNPRPILKHTTFTCSSVTLLFGCTMNYNKE